MHTLIGLQDEEIGWDDEVLQTDGFPVLEEFLVTRIWSQNVQWGLIAAKNVFRPRATKLLVICYAHFGRIKLPRECSAVL